MTPHFSDDHLTIWAGDVRDVLPTLPAESVHCVVTSPPYWGLRDYGTPGQLGLEPTPEEYVADLVRIFREVRRVLRADGTVWLNLGDSYASSTGHNDNSGFAERHRERYPSRSYREGKVDSSEATPDFRHRRTLPGLKPKDLVGVPWLVAFALQADGWYLRSDIIWSKPNPMPESVTDRPTKAHEYVFLLTKSARYWYDADAVREPNSSPEQLAHNLRYAKPYAAYDDRTGPDGTGQPGNTNNTGIHARPGGSGRNLRSVWTIATQPYPGAHFATFPERLVEPCVKAGCPPDGVVLDPFAGSGTTARVANRLGRRAVLIELNPDYIDQALTRNAQAPLGLGA